MSIFFNILGQTLQSLTLTEQCAVYNGMGGVLVFLVHRILLFFLKSKKNVNF
jgi:hypothetical protein